jgi:hypothetical protein
MTKMITLQSGAKVDVNEGDVLFVTIKPDDSSYLVRGRFLDSKDGFVTFSVLNPDLKPESVSVKETRVVRVEKPN